MLLSKRLIKLNREHRKQHEVSFYFISYLSISFNLNIDYSPHGLNFVLDRCFAIDPCVCADAFSIRAERKSLLNWLNKI